MHWLAMFKKGEAIPQPSFEELDQETKEKAPYLVFKIKNEQGEIVRKLYADAKPGIQQMTWNLKFPLMEPVRLNNGSFNPQKMENDGLNATPGTYTIDMVLMKNNTETNLVQNVQFEANLLNMSTLPDTLIKERKEFFAQINETWRLARGVDQYLADAKTRIQYLQQAIQSTNGEASKIMKQMSTTIQNIDSLIRKLNGPEAKASFEELPLKFYPILVRLNDITEVTWESNSAPTKTQKFDLKLVQKEIDLHLDYLKIIGAELEMYEAKANELNAPYTPLRLPKK